MNSFKNSLACLGAGLVLSANLVARADYASDTLKAAPQAVQLAVIQLVGDNKISDFDSEQEGGKTVYDIEFKIKNMSYEADIDASGQVLTREVEIDSSILPPAVIAAAKAAHADGKIGEASIVTAGDKMFYEMDVKAGKDTHEVQISAGGAVLADTIEAPEAGEASENAAKPGEKAESKEADEKGEKDEKN